MPSWALYDLPMADFIKSLNARKFRDHLASLRNRRKATTDDRTVLQQLEALTSKVAKTLNNLRSAQNELAGVLREAQETVRELKATKPDVEI